MLIKRKFICPGCGQEHTVTVDVPVRRRNRTTYRPVYRDSRLEYAIAEVDEGFEYALPWKRINDLLFYPIGFALGGAGGSIVYAVIDAWFGPFYSHEFWLSLALVGAGMTCYWTHWVLVDMAKQDRKKASLLSYWQSHSVPKSEEKPGPVVLEVDHRFRDGHTEAGRTVQYFGALPVDPEAFTEYVRAVLAGETLAIAQWTGAGKPFSRQEYERLLDILRQAGAVVNQPGKGNQLTQHGRRAMQNHLRQYTPDA